MSDRKEGQTHAQATTNARSQRADGRRIAGPPGKAQGDPSCAQAGPDEAKTELSLLDAARQGDSRAFWTLWRMHSSRLFEHCLREMQGNRADAENALALAMMNALAQLPVFGGRIDDIAAWLLELTRNVCNDVRRERTCAGQPAANRDAKQEARRPGSPETGLARETASPEREPDPCSLIDLLSPRLREALVLRVVGQMAYRDIAARLGLSSAGARKRVQQARAALQALRNATDEAAQPLAASPVQRAVRVHPQPGLKSDVDILLDNPPRGASRQRSTPRALVRHRPGWKSG
jgi:RNA polymerase sigma factor (sigma-70 family)